MRADTSSRVFTTRDGRAGSVRPAIRADAEPCLAIVRAATQMRPRTILTTTEELWSVREWRRRMLAKGDSGVTLVATVDGEVAGLLGASRGERTAVRHTAELGITVADRFRALGIGRALMNGFEDWARELGLERLALTVYEHNPVARGLYESLGYRIEGIEERAVKFPDGYVNLVRMAKFI